MLAATFGTGEVLWSMFWFFIFFIWIILLFHVFGDIFRSDDLSGAGKTIWVIFVILVPYLGVFVYLIARGHKMQQRAVASAQARDAASKEYIRTTVGTASTADELTKLSELAATGTITDAEFAAAKAKLLGS